MNLLSERLDKAIARWEEDNGRKFNGAELARASGTSRQTVGDWRVGRTQNIAGVHLFGVADYLNVNPIWLNNGEGSMAGEGKPNNLQSSINRGLLAKAIQLVELVIKKNGYDIGEDEKANIMAAIYDEMLNGEDVSDREINMLLRAIHTDE